MKLSALDEYGIRVLLQIAKSEKEVGLSIRQISELEGLSEPYTGKITRLLRLAGLIKSTRGQKGGYILNKPMKEITIQDTIKALGGELYATNFCGNHPGTLNICTNSLDCSVRSLWTITQRTLDFVLSRITLADLMSTESNTNSTLEGIFESLPLAQ